MDTFQIIILIISIISPIILYILLSHKTQGSDDRELKRALKDLNERMARLEGEMDKLPPRISGEFRNSRQEISQNFLQNRREISENLQVIQKTVDSRVKSLQEENTKKLDEMRETVDEKLKASVEKRFNESFKSISEQLTQVYQGLGEMKNLAGDVGDLKKVMEGVKTRGIYGEVQLGSIIQDMLSENQYEENIATKKGSADRVEFAIRMPGKDENLVYLPIDSKFPIENYSKLLKAYDLGNKETIIAYRKALATDVKTQAKKISTKYLDPPTTTDFGMMFVPTESLYAEILRIPGLSDEIRQKYNVSICSPTTLPTMLSGLLMGFRSVAIEKRSSEVWQTLGAVKTQFSKFSDLLAATKKKLEESANKIGDAESTSRQIEKKLKDVESLPETESVKLIGKVEVEGE